MKNEVFHALESTFVSTTLRNTFPGEITGNIRSEN